MTTISWPEAAAFTLASAVKDAVAQFTAVGIDSARLDAEMLMAETLRVERGRLYMNPDRALDDAALARFRALIAGRAGFIYHRPARVLVARLRCGARGAHAAPRDRAAGGDSSGACRSEITAADSRFGHGQRGDRRP